MPNGLTPRSSLPVGRRLALLLLTAGATLSIVTPAAAQLSRIGSNPALIATGMRGTDSAYDPANGVYLVVGAYGATWGAFTNTSGEVLSTFQINGSGGFAHFPRVAYSPHVSNGAGGTGGFLVTWHEGAGGDNLVHTRIVAYPNRLVTGITTIPSPGSWWEAGAAVAYSTSSRTFFTVFRTGDYRIWGARLNTSGGVMSSGQISPGATFRDPNVAWNPHTDEFGVAYTGWGAGGASTTFTLVGAAGNVIRHNTFNFAGATYIGDLSFNVATNRYVAVWSQGPTHGAEISAGGDVMAKGLVSSTTGTYDGLGLSYNPVSGTFLLVGHGPSYDIWAAELNARGARTSGDTPITSAAGPIGSFYPRAGARTNAPHWNVSFAHNFSSMRDQIVATSSGAGGPAGSLGSVAPTPTSPGGGSTGGCPGTAPFPGAVCVNGGWVPGTTSGGDTGGSTGGCPGTAPFPGAVCVNGGWVAGTGSGGSGSTGGCPGSAPFPGAVCVNGGWVPGTTSGGGSGGSTGGCPGSAPFPGAVCSNGGWVPGTSSGGSGSTGGCPGTAPFPGAVCVGGGWVPGTGSGGSGSTGGCTTPDPFTAIGGGTCVNGGWLPGSSGGSSTGCATPAPGAGWTCVNGGWLPPSMTSSGGSTCTTAPPGSGWVCVNGGWLPPDRAPSSSGGCTTPDPFVAMGGGVCVNGGWVPRNSSRP